MRALLFALTLAMTSAACLPDLAQPSDVKDASAGDSGVVDYGGDAGNTCGDGVIDLQNGEQCDPGDAGAVGCTAGCKVDCTGGFVGPANHCYFGTPEAPLAIAEGSAAHNCVNHNAHVVSIQSDDELELVREHVVPTIVRPNTSGADFWVNLFCYHPAPDAGVSEDASAPDAGPCESFHALNGEPGFDARCPGCFSYGLDGGSETPVIPGVNVGTLETCAVAPEVSEPYGFAAVWCRNANDSLGYWPGIVCEREPPGIYSRPCPGEPTAGCFSLKSTFGRKTYRYESDWAGSPAANRSCQGYGGRLVVLESTIELEELTHEIASWGLPKPVDFWIGLSYHATDAVSSGWSWDAASNNSFRPWGLDQPLIKDSTEQAFIVIDEGRADSSLAQNTSSASHPYVCEIPVPHP